MFSGQLTTVFSLLFLLNSISLEQAAAQDQPATTGNAAVQDLKDAAEGRFSIGVGVPVDITNRSEDWQLLTTHFEIVTPENCMKPQGVQPIEGQFNFESCDRFVEFAAQKNLKIVGHCLVWAKDDRTPDWFFTADDAVTDKATLLQRMKTHIESVAGRYGDKIEMWDVVNEALGDGSEEYLRDSIWTRTCGEEFIVEAFQSAKEAAPNALLIYNDYRCDMPEKREKLIRLIRSIKQKGAPVDAVGLQGHYELDSIPFEGLESMFQAMRELEVKVVVSELDIDVVTRGKWWADDNKYREELKSYDPYKEGCPPEILQRQAEQYAKLFKLFCKYEDVIERVSFWNLHDGQSWLNYFPWNRVNHPLLFDREQKPKPAFESVIDVLVDSPRTHSASHSLTIYAASESEVEGWKVRRFEHKDLWLAPNPLLVGADVLSVKRVSENGNNGVSIEFSLVAGERLFKHTSTHTNDSMAVVFEGEIIAAPKVNSPIRQRALISGQFSEAELKKLIKALD